MVTMDRTKVFETVKKYILAQLPISEDRVVENAALIGYGAALGIGAVWAYGVSLLRLILELI